MKAILQKHYIEHFVSHSQPCLADILPITLISNQRLTFYAISFPKICEKANYHMNAELQL